MKNMAVFLLTSMLVSSSLICLAQAADLNPKPLIGILSQPDSGFAPGPGQSYLAASYVKFVEMGGGRAVPIIYNAPTSKVLEQLAAVNGVLFPGGEADITPSAEYGRVSKLIFDKGMEFLRNGEHFPMHGTCLGLEFLGETVGQDYSILRPTNTSNYPVLLNLTAAAANSRILSYFDHSLLSALSGPSPAVFDNHQFALTYSQFTNNSRLESFFNILATAVGRNGRKYVSLIEAKSYPITGSQFHPEKNVFEVGSSQPIPHTATSARVTQAIATYFIEQARQNGHAPADEQVENDLLIYNYIPTFTGKNGSDFEQVYVFDQPSG